MSKTKVLVELIRTRANGEYVDRFGHIWLIWKDRAVRLDAYS